MGRWIAGGYFFVGCCTSGVKSATRGIGHTCAAPPRMGPLAAPGQRQSGMAASDKGGPAGRACCWRGNAMGRLCAALGKRHGGVVAAAPRKPSTADAAGSPMGGVRVGWVHRRGQAEMGSILIMRMMWERGPPCSRAGSIQTAAAATPSKPAAPTSQAHWRARRFAAKNPRQAKARRGWDDG
ncbi:MAG: hypothetical protein J3K34DRAFT_410845 [Monoraphidium minutum]|nr:MAG: hypothetical protein J3K34DRAFT_410845 [Monoraphidium minutum]